MREKLYSENDEVFRHEYIEEAVSDAWECQPLDTEILTVYEADLDEYVIVKVTPHKFKRVRNVDSDDFDFNDFEEVPEPPNTALSGKPAPEETGTN